MDALPVVETGSGRVRGCEEGGLAVFRGVRFAEPPVGALRLAPPRPPAPWAGVRDALAFGPAAPQRVGLGLRLVGDADLRTDEDCLTLNVWTPAADAGKRPVLVFVHGGSYVSGAGSVTALEGASLARRGDVVVVTLNYRLGALGFLGLDPDGRVRAGNLSLRDQIRALEWVQGNVERFGGDPRRVTVFGESAGSMSLGVLLGVPCARGLFGRAILQSGAPAASPPAEAERVVQALCRELGVEPDDGTRLRELPVGRFVEAQDRAAAQLWRELSGLPFQPVVDGELVPAAPREGLRAGGAQGVEILVGTNLDECRYFGLADPKARQLTDAALLRRCAHRIRGHEAGVAHAERVVTGYRRHRAARSVSTAPPDLWFAIETDRLFRVPSAALAELHAGLGSSAYMYLFTWASPALEGALGACHALELPFVFGTVGLPGLRWLVGEGAEALSERMQEIWIGFARDGRPDGAHWPAYDAERRATFLFGRECGLAEAPFDAERRLWAGLLP